MGVNLKRLNHFFAKYGDNRARLAEKLGMTRQNLGQILAGKQAITVEVIRKIAVLYEMTPEDVYWTFIFPEGIVFNNYWEQLGKENEHGKIHEVQ